MDQDILRHVAQITISYLKQNSVASSELSDLVEIIGREILKLHGQERRPTTPGLVAKRTAETFQKLIGGLQSHSQPKPEGRAVLSPGEYRGKRNSRPGRRAELPVDAPMRLTLAQHIELVQRMISERERLGLAPGGTR